MIRRRTKRMFAVVGLIWAAALIAVVLFAGTAVRAEEPDRAVTGHHSLYVEKAVNGDWLLTDGLVVNWRANDLWDVTVAYDAAFTRGRAAGPGMPNHAWNDWDLAATYRAPWAWLKGGWITLGYRWRWWIEGNAMGRLPGVEEWNYVEVVWGW